MNSNFPKAKAFRSILAFLALNVLVAGLIAISPLASAQNAPTKQAEPGSFDPYPFYLNLHSQPMMSFRVYNPETANKPKRFDTIGALKKEREMRLMNMPRPAAGAETPASTSETTYSPSAAPATAVPETTY